MISCSFCFSLVTQTVMETVYCRYGHNELDDPTITLPLSYQAVAQHPPVLQRYASKLHQMGVVGTSEVHSLQVTAASILMAWHHKGRA